MNDDMTDFINSCLELGKDLLDKDDLTGKEENFINQLNNITEKYILNNNFIIKSEVIK